LHHRRVVAVRAWDNALFEGDHLETVAHDIQQFAGAQQVIGIPGRAGIAFVA